MRRGSSERTGGRFWAAARYGSEESSFISQIQPVLRPRSSATWARVNSSASPRFSVRLSSWAISFSTESSWLRRRRSFCPPSLEYSLIASSTSFGVSAGRQCGLIYPAPSPQKPPEQAGAEDQSDEGDENVAEGLRDGQEVAPVGTEGVADERVGHRPHGGGREVVGEEPVVLHPAHPGEQGGHAS